MLSGSKQFYAYNAAITHQPAQTRIFFEQKNICEAPIVALHMSE